MRPVPPKFDVKVVGVSFRPDYPDGLLRLAESYAALPTRECPECDGRGSFADAHGVGRCEACGGTGTMQAPGEASLVRDRENEHDPNAVAVLAGGAHVGYLPRELAQRVGTEIDDGAHFRVTAAEVMIHPEHPERPGLTIEVERIQPQGPNGTGGAEAR